MIVVAGHVGSNEAVGAALAGRGYPVSVIADDSSYPGAVRAPHAASARLGRPGHPVAQPARAVRGAQAQGDPRPARRLGLPRRRHPGAAVRRLDHAARRARPRWPRRAARSSPRSPSGGSPTAATRSRRTATFTVPSSDPADIQRATQRIADALEATIAAAPEQWYSFKPMWPDDPAEARALEARATAMLRLGRPAAPRPRPSPDGPAAAEAACRRDRTRAAGDRRARRASAARSSMAGACARVARCPRRPLVAAAESAGELWYRLAPATARPGAREPAPASARAWPRAAAGRAARPARGDRPRRPRAPRPRLRSATPPATTSRSPGPAPTTSRPRSRAIDVETPGRGPRGARVGRRRSIIVGMHFGAIELPGRARCRTSSGTASRRRWRPSPTRPSSAGSSSSREPRRRQHRPDRERAPRPARARSARGESVGLVADRDLTGTGIDVPFFGHPAPIPAGPALLAARDRRADLRRRPRAASRDGRYRGRLIRVPTPETGTRRERIVGLTAAIAAAFESLLADAPEQWWGAFHPIWPDLDQSRDADGRPTATDRREPTVTRPDRPRPGRPPHPHARVGRDGVGRRDPRPRRARGRPRRHRDHRPRADRRRPGGPRAWPRTAACAFGWSSARRSAPAAATCSGCSSSEPVPAAAEPRAGRSRPSTSRAASRSRPIRSSRTRCARRAFVLRRLLDDADPAVRPDAHRDVQPHGARPVLARAGRPVRRGARPGPGRQQRRPRARRRSAPAGRRFPGRDRRRRPRRDPRRHHAPSRRLPRHGAASSATFGRQLRKYGRDARRRGRRPAAPRRHRPRPRLPGRAPAGRRASSPADARATTRR